MDTRFILDKTIVLEPDKPMRRLPNRAEIDSFLQRQYERGVRDMKQAASVLEDISNQLKEAK
jgi:hypothetical protein